MGEPRRRAYAHPSVTRRRGAVFAVDLFNAGVVLPNVDTVMMLRPTESQTVWLQQFGRGLRRRAGKLLRVIDYIGNHRTFLLKPQTLLQLRAAEDRALNAALTAVTRGEWELPKGCEVTYDLAAVDIRRGLLRLPKVDDALRAYYDDFRERHGARPTASEAFHDGYAPGSVRGAYGSWPAFVQSMGDLDEAQRATFASGRSSRR